MTAEPRMEDLLASIRKAINEDIGDGPARPAPGKGHAARSHEAVKPASEASVSSSEINELRAKITRARSAGPVVSAPEPMQRAASLTAALQNGTPRRPWQEIQPTPPPVRLRGSTSEADPVRNVTRPDIAPRSLTPVEAPAVLRPVVETPRAEPAAIISGTSAQSVQTAFSRLADSVLSRATGDRSVEDMTRELLRGMLKQWLDENLPAMVERMVREEIERVARTGR